MVDDCFICQKHAGLHAHPPGGYIFDDGIFSVCHAPAAIARLGTFFVESIRHVLDFADFSAQESAAYGPLLQRLYGPIKSETGAERLYTIVLLEGIAHFHTWLVPRMSGDSDRGSSLLAQKFSCNPSEAEQLANKIRTQLARST